MDSSTDESSSSVQVPDMDDFELMNQTNEIVIDETGEDPLLTDQSLLSSLALSDDTPRIKPRAYQFEMLEQFLQSNIIVAVGCDRSRPQSGQRD
jgi:hypothetical protein